MGRKTGPEQRRLLADEIRIGDWRRERGPLKAAVCYPNTYAVGMASLGFLTVYRLLAADQRFSTDRAFMPDQESDPSGGLRTFEDRTELTALDLIAFSISFENDYLNVARMLHLAGIPLLAKERTGKNPLVLAGGVALGLNPEPLAELLDVVYLGEAEGGLDRLLDVFCRNPRGSSRGLPEQLKDLPHVYVPSAYRVRYNDRGTIESMTAAAGFPERISQARCSENTPPAYSPIVTPHSAFPSMLVVETGRGCSHRCRFCAAGFHRLPPRTVPAEKILEVAGKTPEGVGLGLLGSAVSDHREIHELIEGAAKAGRRVSLSSVRAGNLTEKDYGLLAESGLRQLTLAPEAGSEALRRSLNKPISDEEFLAESELLAAAGIARLKLYFMIGLPGETDRDVGAIVKLALAIQKRMSTRLGREARIEISVSPFVPKAQTPLQWAPMAGSPELKRKQKFLREAIKKPKWIKLSLESIRLARFQGLLALGDRRLGEVLILLGEKGLGLKQALSRTGIDEAFYLERIKEADEKFPWDFIDTGVGRAALRREYELGQRGKASGPCRPGRCRLCEICEINAE